jgi:hypothetical protein
MRTSAIITGIIFLFLTILALMFRIMHWPGSGLGAMLGIFLFSIVYLPLLLGHNLNSKPPALMIWAFTAGTIAGIIFFIGALFIIMIWPGGKAMFISGLVAGTIFLVLYIAGLVKHPNVPRFTIFTIINIVMVLVVFLSMKMSDKRSLEISRKIEEYKLQSMEQEKLLAEISVLTEASVYSDSLGFVDSILVLGTNPVITKSDELRGNIRGITREVVAQTEVNFRQDPFDIDTMEVDDLVSLTINDIPSFYLVGFDPELPVGKGTDLLKFLVQWKKMMSVYGAPDSLIKINLDETVDLQGKHTPWVTEKFYEKMLIEDMIELKKLENEVVRTERDFIKYLLENKKKALAQ